MKYSIVFKIGNKKICTELATGSSESFKKYNIYDLAGNLWEWTTGHNIIELANNTSKEMFVVPRGGGFAHDGMVSPVVTANGHDSSSKACIDVSFRVVLYVKYPYAEK